MSYRGRATDGASDNDLYGYLSLDGGDPDVDDALFHLLGRVTYDFDGDSNDPGDPFYSLNDLSGSLDSHLYEGFVDLQRNLVPGGFGVNRIRLGRQDLYAAFTYLVDGARVDFEPVKSLGCLRVSVFGGIPEYLYEDSRAGDWIAGFDATFKPWRDGRLTLRYAHVQDEAEWVDNNINNYASVALWQRVNDDLNFYANWNTIDAGTRDASLRVDWFNPRCDLTIHGTYRYQSTITDEYVTVYDPYVGVLGTSYSYHEIDLDASKLFCNEHLGIDAGFSARVLADASNESAFNHEFVRGWLTVSGYRWPCPDVDVSVTGEFWSATGDQTASMGGEITWRPTEKLKMMAGSYYSLYKHDLFIVDEREDVTTLFLRACWRARDDLRFDGRIEFETGGEGNFITGVLGVTWTF